MFKEKCAIVRDKDLKRVKLKVNFESIPEIEITWHNLIYETFKKITKLH